MTITATVHQGRIALPPGVALPDGTRVEIVVPSPRTEAEAARGSVRLPTFRGDGLQPGVNLDDSRELRRLLDETGKSSQLP